MIGVQHFLTLSSMLFLIGVFGIFLNRKNIIYLLLDVNSEDHIKHFIKRHKIDYIFHAAAYKHVNILEQNLVSAVKNNILATVSLLNAIKKI